MKQGDRMESGASGTVVKARSAKQLTALKEDLRKRFRQSPSALHDWALREQAAVILATMSTQELGAFAMEFVPEGDPFSSIRSWRNIHDPLLHEILRQWGIRDPEGACAKSAEMHFGILSEVFGLWQRRDPAAAQTWLETASLPKEGDQIRTNLQWRFLNQQVTTDFSAARESLAKLHPGLQKRMLLDWSQLLANDPDKRTQFLALLAARGDKEFSEKCYQALVVEMANKSPNEAANYIESTDLPEDQKDKLNDQVMVKWARQDPVQALGKWVELNRPDMPPDLLDAFASWSLGPLGVEQAKAIDWVKKLTPGLAREKFIARLIQGLGEGHCAQAADLGDSLDDPEERIRQLKIVKRRWEEKHPNEAKAWYEKLPQEDKDAMAR